jgi:hypothetical protein
MPRRWVGYIQAWDNRAGQSVLLELTPGCMTKLNEHLAEHGTLRMWDMTLERKPAKSTGQLLITSLTRWKGTTEDAERAPAEANVQQELLRLWRIQTVIESGEDFKTQIANVGDQVLDQKTSDVVQEFIKASLEARKRSGYNTGESDAA